MGGGGKGGTSSHSLYTRGNILSIPGKGCTFDFAWPFEGKTFLVMLDAHKVAGCIDDAESC